MIPTFDMLAWWKKSAIYLFLSSCAFSLNWCRTISGDSIVSKRKPWKSNFARLEETSEIKENSILVEKCLLKRLWDRAVPFSWQNPCYWTFYGIFHFLIKFAFCLICCFTSQRGWLWNYCTLEKVRGFGWCLWIFLEFWRTQSWTQCTKCIDKQLPAPHPISNSTPLLSIITYLFLFQ